MGSGQILLALGSQSQAASGTGEQTHVQLAFQSLQLLATVPITRFGYMLGSESIYLGKGFVPGP